MIKKQKKTICTICDERDKQTRAYVHCSQGDNIICMEHCEKCQYLRKSMGQWRCTYEKL